MTAFMIAPPAVEPVTLAEARAHLRVSADAEDGLIGRLVTAARAEVERLTRRALVHQDWRLALDAWPPGRVVHFPLAPVASVILVTVYDANGMPQPLAADAWTLDRAGEPPRLKAAPGAPAGLAGLNGIEIDFRAGYGADAEAVPAPLRQAILLLVAHWFERRELIEAAGTPGGIGLPGGFGGLIASHRRLRL